MLRVWNFLFERYMAPGIPKFLWLTQDSCHKRVDPYDPLIQVDDFSGSWMT